MDKTKELITKNSRKQLIEVLLQHSESKVYEEAIKEWVDFGNHFQADSFCICGQPIFENCPIINKVNGNKLVVGNYCIKKFGIEKTNYNKSRANYLEYALSIADTDGAKEFVNKCCRQLLRYNSIYSKDIEGLVFITGKEYRWR